jgi:hypothetical protein
MVIFDPPGRFCWRSCYCRFGQEMKKNPKLRHDGKKPAIARQVFTVDARGYPAELWKEIAPPQ